jgi:hypothetical protein
MTKIKTQTNTKKKSMLRNVLFFLPILVATLYSQQPPQQSAVPTLPADIPSTADRYSFLMMGNQAGQQAVWTASDGMLHIFYQFNDRGRGPKTTSILKLGPDSIPVSEVITGNDYMKAQVTENYSLEAGIARWKNDDEQGEKKISTPAFYAPLNGGPSEIALLAQAALHNGGRIALLPEGEARVQRDLAAKLAHHESRCQRVRRRVKIIPTNTIGNRIDVQNHPPRAFSGPTSSTPVKP